jgi:hypothetical protein
MSDIAIPPWFYIALREPIPVTRVIRPVRWFGRSPARAASSILVVGTLSEFCQHFWPGGPIVGTFDPWDLTAYAGGLLICVLFDTPEETVTSADGI